jgi:predicted DCC family thiol-disulfide oxidoreductase YuxK
MASLNPTFMLTIVLYDGKCDICNGIVRFLTKNDKSKSIKFISRSSDLGMRYLESLPSITLTVDSVIVLMDGRFYIKSQAIIKLAQFLTWPWKMVSVFRILPLSFRDRLYDRVAKKRYLLLPRKNSCQIPAFPQDQQVI